MLAVCPTEVSYIVNLSWPAQNAFALYPILPLLVVQYWTQFSTARLIHTAICFEPCRALPGLVGSVNRM